MVAIGIRAIHLFVYSIGFGGSLFYSYVASPIAFKKLQRDQFGILQSNVFPIYFLGQTIIPSILFVTSPNHLTKLGIWSLAISTLGGLSNILVLSPICHRIKDARSELVDKGLDTIDGVQTEEYKKLTKQFGMYHGLSLLANLASILGLGVYGISFI